MKLSPSDAKRVALEILAEIPHTYIALHNAEIVWFRSYYVDSIRDVHSSIASEFGEPHPDDIGILQIVDDLSKWVPVWSWHPNAGEWIDRLQRAEDAAWWYLEPDQEESS